MNKILLKTDLGESVLVNILRCFDFNGAQYMIYSLNEVDESNYMKLYGVKLGINQDGTVIATAIDDSIWTNIISLIKDIVKAKTQGNQININEIDLQSIESINLISKRIFKIDKNMANLLSNAQDEKNSNDSIMSVPIQENLQQVQQNTNEFTYPEVPVPDFQNNIPVVENNMPIDNNINPQIDNNINYKQLYEQLLEQNKILTEQNELLKSKISNIDNIIKG